MSTEAFRPTANSLAGRVAVVTGAGSGIGRGVALELARAGAQLVLVDVVARRLEAVESEVGDCLLAAAVDVSDESEVDRLGAAVAKLIPVVHVLVNCAGILDDMAPTAEMKPSTW